MSVVVLLLIFAIHNIAVVCKIVTSSEFTFFYCNLLQLQVTEKSNSLPVTS